MKVFKSLIVAFFLLSGLTALAQQKVTVRGEVVAADTGEPLIGAFVVTGPSSGVSTSVDGTYEVSVDAGTTLSFQFIGFQPTTFLVPSGQKEIVHNVTLESDSQALEDVVVVAYGVRKKGTIAGSVSTVKSDAIADTPAASFDQALQGKATGLMVLSNSGEPSATASFQIRGTNSINSGTSPLFILDGIPISASDFNAISPNDIESVSVLKDASSTSIYGARAANGVVVITTKRGRIAQDARITLRTQAGFSQIAGGKWNLMNTAERIQYEQEVGLTDGKNYEKLAKTDINWLNEVFNKYAPLQNYELQASGATDKLNYYVSGGYYSQDGTTADSDFNRYNFRVNLEAQAKKWLKIGTNSMLAYEKYDESVEGVYAVNTPIAAARFMLPYWNPYRPDGSIASINDGSWKGLGENPLEWSRNNPYTTKKYKAIANMFAEATIIDGLVLKVQGGVDYTHGAVKSTSTPSYLPNNGQGKAGRNSSDAFNLTVTTTLNYGFDVKDDHHLNIMLGQEGVDYRSEGFSVSTAGQSNDWLTDVSSATRATGWSSTNSSYSYVSFFGRGEYNWGQRLYADLSVRGDGSSRFGSKGRWAAFWSVGLMWNVKSENFLKDVDWLTNAQLAVSTGTSGNSSIPNYDHLALVSGGKEYWGQAAIGPYSKGNENLEWEKLMTTNVALHLGFWNRINLDAEFYNKKTTNMLMSVPVSYADGGYGFKWDNVGAMVNRGVELNLGVDVIAARNFHWNVNANVSYNYNAIKELYNGLDEYVVSTTGTKLVVGHSYGEFFLNRFAGVNPVNGDALWYDKDGNITNEIRDSDKVMVGKSCIAPWMGGFGTSLAWKGLSLSAQFSWVADRWMVNNDRFFEEGGGLFDAYNQSRRMLYDRWKKPGDVTDVPRHGVSPQFDTHLLEDASFLRLKNLMLSYSLPSPWMEKTRFFSGIRVYAQAQNLLTFTGFSGLDPESSSNVYKAQYPLARQFTFGLELTF
ncbi:MAG: TonB-dependent receptor [Candidatus Cryptobacteroides sp.]|nr:TonB-dependent receptor [Candidatus Cryptobacteroides sp.]